MFYDDYGAMDRWEDSNPVLQPGGAPGPALYGMGLDEGAAQALSGLALGPILEELNPRQQYFESPQAQIDYAGSEAGIKAAQITQAIKTTGEVIAGITNAFATVQSNKQRAELEDLYRKNQIKQQNLIALQRQLQQQSTFVKQKTSTSTWVILIATGVILLGGAFVIGKGK